MPGRHLGAGDLAKTEVRTHKMGLTTPSSSLAGWCWLSETIFHLLYYLAQIPNSCSPSGIYVRTQILVPSQSDESLPWGRGKKAPL